MLNKEVPNMAEIKWVKKELEMNYQV